MAKKKEIDLGRVEDLAAQGLTYEQIADALGISVRTLDGRRSESADFADAIPMWKLRYTAKAASRSNRYHILANRRVKF